jgi:hypothetical protein
MKKPLIILIVAIVLVGAVIAVRRKAFKQGLADAVPDANGMARTRGNSFLGWITDDAYRSGKLSYKPEPTPAQ